MNIALDDAATGPLAGLRVLDFSHALAGPFCSMFLSDLGADVIKVEHPRRGDGTRHMGQPLLGPLDTDYFVALNRGKRSIALDLKDPDDLATAKALVASCDALVHNYRPGVMERLGLGYDDLKSEHPDLVYVAISGYGEEGELASRGANDITMQAMAGLMATTGEVGEPPLRLGVSLVDMTTGLFALVGALSALLHRANGGPGQRVHVSMLSSAVALLANYIPSVLTQGKEIHPSGRQHAQLVPYQSFETSDGGYVIVGAFTQAFWVRFARLLGRADLVDDPRFATNGDRVAHREVLIPILEKEMRKRPRDAWLSDLEAADIPTAPVHSVGEALRHPQVHRTGAVVELTDGESSAWVTGLPVELSETPGRPRGFAPRLGQHSDEVRTLLGSVGG
jgi:crotonobetainyl-CoA:carnitine CoA-transferase CaiB-like acyl-CoA transferase